MVRATPVPKVIIPVPLPRQTVSEKIFNTLDHVNHFHRLLETYWCLLQIKVCSKIKEKSDYLSFKRILQLIISYFSVVRDDG